MKYPTQSALTLFTLFLLVVANQTTALTFGSFEYTVSGGEVTIIGYDCVSGSSDVVIPSEIPVAGDPVTAIGASAFEDCTILNTVTIPSSVTSIEPFAFRYCYDLTTVTTSSNSILTIGDGAFLQCTSLTSLTIPVGVTTIGASAFEDCVTLPSLTLPDSLTTIGSYAFKNCDALSSVTIPVNVDTIGDGIFSDCQLLTSIDVAPGNTFFTSNAGVLFDSSATTLYQFPAGLGGTYAIPGTVTTIGNFAFYHCADLTEVTIPASVTSIGSSAFYDCNNLTSLTIPDAVTIIGSAAFERCTGLISVINGANLTTIGSRAFYQCTGLTHMTIPEGVTDLGDRAFGNCSNLASLYFLGTPPTLGGSLVFSGTPSGLTSYYVEGTAGWDPTYGSRPTQSFVPYLSIAQPGGILQVEYAGGTLQESSDLSGWENVNPQPEPGNPWLVTLSSGEKAFFRFKPAP